MLAPFLALFTSLTWLTFLWTFLENWHFLVMTIAFFLTFKRLNFAFTQLLAVGSTSNHVTTAVNFGAVPAAHLTFWTSSTLGNITSALSLTSSCKFCHCLASKFETAVFFASFVV